MGELALIALALRVIGNALTVAVLLRVFLWVWGIY